MMHPYFVATLLVGTVAVAYGAYIIYREFAEEPILLYNTRGREGYHSDDEDSSIVESEKNGLRRRRVRRENNSRNDEEEQELLDKYSYLTALEQEIERKKKQLVDEERLLHEKEQEIQNRKQHLSISSQSSSNSCEVSSPLFTQRKSSISSSETSASEVLVNGYDKSVLTEGILPVTSNSPQSVVSIKTVSSDENDQPRNRSSDVAAHTILSQHLSHITHQQQTPNPSIIIQNSDAPADSKTNPSLISEQHSYPVNNSHFVAKSVASEEAWSEVDSVLSENIGSVMSSAVDIDMEEVDVIEH